MGGGRGAAPPPQPDAQRRGFGLERSRKGAGEGCPHLGVPSLSGLCGDEVDVGDNGNISQFLVPHFLNPPAINPKTHRPVQVRPDVPKRRNRFRRSGPPRGNIPLKFIQTVYYTALWWETQRICKKSHTNLSPPFPGGFWQKSGTLGKSMWKTRWKVWKTENLFDSS